MQLPQNKYDPKIEYQRKKDKERRWAVENDIDIINTILEENDEQKLAALHCSLDGKYQTCIVEWGQSMYGYLSKHGFNYELLDSEALRHNITLMKAKLEGFMQGWNSSDKSYIPSHKSDVNVTVNNTVQISVSFEETRQKIEQMTALSQSETDEILDKIDKLELISQESVSRKNKWEKVKPIILFALDKGADVAIAILSLVVQMKLGI